MTHLDFLRNVSLFDSWDQQELEALSDGTFTRTFSKDNVIILAEEEGDTLFILKKGQVKVSIVSEGGREVILSLLGPGSVFGELSLLDGKPRSANVVATEETDLLMLRRADFLQLIYKTPQIATAPPVSRAHRPPRPHRRAPARLPAPECAHPNKLSFLGIHPSLLHGNPTLLMYGQELFFEQFEPRVHHATVNCVDTQL